MLVKDFVKRWYSQLPLDKEDVDKKHETYYQFMHYVYKQFITSLGTDVDEEDLVKCLDPGTSSLEHFRAPYTKIRFVHCLEKICKQNLQILALCYKGNLPAACKALEKELFSAYLGKYLGEHYINNIRFEIERDTMFFRMRDERIYDDKGHENVVDNCWHVPFDKRHCAATCRFSLLGYPCLYLGDNKNTSDAEIGPLEAGKRRWVAPFEFKQPVLLYDLRIPSEEDIDNKDSFGLFQLLLNYPLIAICSAKSHRKGFNEEYYFPQLFFHFLLSPGDDRALSYKGIAYSSTKWAGGYNIVLPAFYTGGIPPEESYSQVLKDLLKTDKPEIYK